MKKRTMLTLLTLCASTLLYAQKLPSREEISHTLKRVADWQIEHYDKDRKVSDCDWTNGALFTGMFDWAQLAEQIDGEQTYYKWLYKIGSRNRWHPDREMYHADAFAVCQTYIDLYLKYKTADIIRPTLARTEFVINHPSDEGFNISYKDPSTLERWTWCDALFMAPPVYVKLYRLTGEKRFMDFADKEFRLTTAHLYDTEEDLYYRDYNYMPPKKEANGQKIFWGRGNGWVIAGLANILKELPEGDPYRPYYKDLYLRFAKRLAELQQPDGYWHASLLDPKSYPAPETSCTGFITYGLAYGINAGLLDKGHYLPIVAKGWKAMTDATDADGRLGYVQPVGAEPKSVTRDMTAVYGPGAMLSAGCEVYRLAK